MKPDDWKPINKDTIDRFLVEQFGVMSPDSWEYLTSGKTKIWVHLEKVKAPLEISKFKCTRMGLYFGSFDLRGIRLSIEGSQLIGNLATQNLVSLSREGAVKWFQGEPLEMADHQTNKQGFVILKTARRILGCGYITQGRILNFLPKTRQIPQTRGKRTLD
ncbi:MAG: methyltransferase RsmF C-terminal domain-like protein [Candidatus Ranarchaeia archaeon]